MDIMKWLTILLLIKLTLMIPLGGANSGTRNGRKNNEDDRCLIDYPEVNPKKYFHLEGRALDIVLEASDRVTHQLTTWVFYYFAKEVLGYARVKIINETDYFNIESVLGRLTDTNDPVAQSTINLEVWIPPDYDTYVTDLVKECGSVSPPGRFGWFIPTDLDNRAIKEKFDFKDLPYVKSIHWRYFRDEDFVKYFDIDKMMLNEILQIDYDYDRVTTTLNGLICNSNSSYDWCIFTPDQCKNQKCAFLLTSYWNATNFVIEHIKENNLLVKVLFLENHLAGTVNKLKMLYRNSPDKSIVILNWAPSDVILHEKNFLSVAFENCARLNFTHSDKVHCKYEMHRLVKVAWSKVEAIAKPLYRGLRSFKFEDNEYERLLDLYERYHNQASYKQIACQWMRENEDTWFQWKQGPENTIYIGGIFPMSGSSYSGKGIVHGALMAQNAINRNSSILPDYKLQLLVTDGMCKAENVMKNFIDFIVDGNYYNNLVGVLGPACSDTVEPLAGVSKYYHIMVISYSAEGSSFSSREKYPYFFRTIGENKHYKHVYLELMKRFNWKRVAALTEDGQKYTEYISSMQDQMEQNGITFISNKKFPRERETEPMTRYLEDLREKRARIIIADVVDQIARQVMCEALKLNMTGVHGYVWFLPMWLNSTWYNTDYFNAAMNETVNCTTKEMIKAITGYFSLTHSYYAPDNQTMQENKTVGEWKEAYKKIARGNTSNYSGFAYDAVWVYASALDKLAKTDAEALSDLHSENTTNKLVKLIEKTDFYGVSGRIKFRNGPSRFSVIQILEWYDNKQHLIGEFNPNLSDNRPEIRGGELVLHSSKIKWFTPDGSVPEDGQLPPPICAFDFFAKMFNVECHTALIIFNVICAVVLIIAVVLVCGYVKYRFYIKMKQQTAYMRKLGIDSQYQNDLEKWEVPRENVRLNRKLGQGAFGIVYGGEANIQNLEPEVQVAVKTLNYNATSEDSIDFLAEARALKNFDHKNIVNLLGVVTTSLPLYTIMEYCLYGDLKTYLLARRDLVKKKADVNEEVTPKRLTSMALDIARGLSYIAGQRYVHRDIACRNCLVGAQHVVKIGDFGMSRPIWDNDCYRFTRKGMLPVRWMAPESLSSGIFGTASDVWSYGVVLYEMVTFGCTPWSGKANSEVVDLVRNGACLEVPRGVKPQLEALMRSCWARDLKNRPTASSIVEFIANNQKLLSACTEVPPDSIIAEDTPCFDSKVDELLKEHLRQFNNKSPKSISPSNDEQTAIALVEQDEDEEQQHENIFDVKDDSVSIPLEYCPKAPLLGGSKSTNSLINQFGKFHAQTNRRDSMDGQDEDEGFITNSPSNGYINSRL